MSHGKLAAYRRRFFGRDERFGTGSLLFDLHRVMHRQQADSVGQGRKTRLFSGL